MEQLLISFHVNDVGVEGLAHAALQSENREHELQKELNDKLLEVYEECDLEIKKEREKLTNTKEYVMLEVNKFAKTNKFIYFRGKYSEKEKSAIFTLKK